MIRADKRGPRAWAWARYIDWRLRRDFAALWVRGPLPSPGEPLLFYGNHGSWWDGFLFHALCRATGHDAHCVMEEQHLARHPFLRRLGAFSVRRGDPASALETLRYAAGLLERPDAAVMIFPQGVLTPDARPPLQLERGVEVLARVSRVRCVPLAMRLGFFEADKPEVLLELGAPHLGGPMRDFAKRLDELVTSVQAASVKDGFSRLGEREAPTWAVPMSRKVARGS